MYKIMILFSSNLDSVSAIFLMIFFNILYSRFIFLSHEKITYTLFIWLSEYADIFISLQTWPFSAHCYSIYIFGI